MKFRPAYAFSFLAFLGILIFFLSQLSIFSQLNEPPKGLHAWRQTDGAAMAYTYAQDNRSFLNPSILGQTSDFLESGDCAPSEAPVIYYFVGKLYQWFGFNEAYFRWITLGLFLIAILGAFWLFFGLKHQFFESALPLLFWISSPILLYYSNNFLSNMSALSMAVLGFAFGYRFIYSGKTSFMAWACVFYAIAGVFKITALLGLTALLLAYLVKSIYKKQSLLDKNMLWMILAYLPTAAWILYAKAYNEEHLCYAFSTQLFPIWDLDFHGIQYHLELIAERWKGQFYPTISLWVLGVSALLFLINWNRISSFYRLWVGIAFLGVIAYVAMQFQVLFAHDYYFINLFIFPLMLLLPSLGQLKIGAKSGSNWLVGILLLLLFIQVIPEVKSIAHQRFIRYEDVDKERLMTLEPWLKRVGVGPDDKIVFAADASHVSLYYLKRKGWTQCGYPLNEDGTMADSENYAFRLTVMAKNNAKYLMLYGDSVVKKYPELEKHKGEYVADTFRLHVYDFKP